MHEKSQKQKSTHLFHIHDIVENNALYKRQETDWWFLGTGGEERGLSVKDKVTFWGDENVLVSLWWGNTTDFPKICKLYTKKSILIVCIPQQA